MDIAHERAARDAVPASPQRGQSSAEPRSSAGRRSFSAGRGNSTEPQPSIAQLIDEIRAAFNARFYLFELEAKRAAWSAAYMMAFGVGAALLGVTAWLILIGALIVGAVAAGVPWVLAAVVAVALHVIAVFFLVRGIRAMAENLTFAATRRTLSNSEPPKTHHGSGA